MAIIVNAIRLRIKEWKYFAAGKITFLQALASMPPSSIRPKFTTEVRLFGQPYILPIVNVGFMVDFIEQILEKDQYRVDLIGKNAIVIDAGANLGVFSIFAAVRHPDATIYAFEPTPETFRILAENVKYYPNIKAFSCALGEKNGVASLVLTGHGGGVENHIGDNGISVPMKTIDSLHTKVDFIKMDTEGYEANIIKGAAGTIRRWKPVIAMSAYHKPGDKTELPRLLDEIEPYFCELRHDAEEDLICVPRTGPLPYVSVIVSTFNRCGVLGECLKSLKSQTYPKDLYEVIVVDDSSTDDTAEIVRSNDAVRMIRNAMNVGPAVARNIGIAAAKGEIIACIDDDAVADPQWLEHLVVPFSSLEIAASGGLVLAYKTNRLAERYLAAIGSGNPAPLAFGTSKNPLRRFMVYLATMLSAGRMQSNPVEVQAVFGVNAAYRTSAIQAFGSFDPALRYDEDTDVSLRIRERGGRIVYVPDAIVRHRHRSSLPQLIQQTYRNAWNTLYLYAKDKKVLPIFPLPVFYFTISVLLLFLQPVAGVLFVTMGPDVLYVWWPIRAFRERRAGYLAYGYIQLTIECAAIIGLIAGRKKAASAKVRIAKQNA